MSIPSSISEISLEWIQDSICWNNIGDKPIAIKIESDFGAWSLLGKLAKVKLLYDKSGTGPKSVIVKIQSQHSMQLREFEIYRLLAEAKVDGIPHLFAGNEHGTLIMEDVSPAKPRSRTKACSIEEARQVISTLARIHRHFWNDARVPSSPSEQYAAIIEFNMSQCWDIFNSRYKDQLGITTDDFIWMWRNSFLVSSQHDSWPSVLSHADLHLENILFSGKEDERPVIIDWQISGSKVSPFDLSYFIVQSFTPSQRRENEERLCKEYYENLPMKVRSEYSFDRFWLDYRACLTRSMVSAVMSPGPRFKTRPDQMEVADILAERVITAVKDLKPVEAIKALKNEFY